MGITPRARDSESIVDLGRRARDDGVLHIAEQPDLCVSLHEENFRGEESRAGPYCLGLT